MKREHLLAVVEKAVGRAMESLVQAHPEALQGHVARSLEKRLIGMLGAELLLAMGHQPQVKLRAPGEGYRPSPAARRMQRLQPLAPIAAALETRVASATPAVPTGAPEEPPQADRRGTGDSEGLANESPAMLALVRALAQQAAREDLAAALAARQSAQDDQNSS